MDFRFTYPCTLLLSCLLGLTCGCAPTPNARRSDPTVLFEQMERHRFNDVARTLQAHLESAPADRSARFGRAIALLGATPRTEGTVLEAQALLQQVVSGNPDDELGIAGEYLRARILQRHLGQPRIEEAKAAFRSLFERHPSHPVAQYALVKFATMEIFSRPGEARPDDVLSRLEPFGERLQDPTAVRSFHHVMGQAYQIFGLSEADALRHYQRALEVGFAKDNLQSDMLLRVAELARKTGNSALARAHYHTFLSNYPRERRAHLVREILTHLKP